MCVYLCVCLSVCWACAQVTIVEDRDGTLAAHVSFKVIKAAIEACTRLREVGTSPPWCGGEVCGCMFVGGCPCWVCAAAVQRRAHRAQSEGADRVRSADQGKPHTVVRQPHG